MKLDRISNGQSVFFFQTESGVFRAIVTNEGVAVDPVKLEKVRNWPIPQYERDVQKFLGLANYFRRFVEIFSTTARPLHHLTEKSVHLSGILGVRKPLTACTLNSPALPSWLTPTSRSHFS